MDACFLCRTNKGQALKASYIHAVNPSFSIAAAMTHRFSTFENDFTIGSSHAIDPLTIVKIRFSNKGKVAMLCQHEWRPKSLITVSAEYDSKSINAAPKMGLTLALKPWHGKHVQPNGVKPFEFKIFRIFLHFFTKHEQGSVYPDFVLESHKDQLICK